MKFWFKIILISSLGIYSFSNVKAVLVINNDTYNDSQVLAAGQQQKFAPVFYIETPKGGSTGVLIDLPENPDLKGRIVLTAAHVIQPVQKEQVFIFNEGLKPNEDSDSTTLENPLPIERLIPSPRFVMNNEAARPYDFGVIILKNPIAIEPLRLVESPIPANTPILVSGYGDKRIAKNGQYVEPITSDPKRRAYESIITNPNEESRLYFTKPSAEIIGQKYVFPSPGDSGGAIFKSANPATKDYSQFIGIVSGINVETEYFAYVCPRVADIRSLLQ